MGYPNRIVILVTGKALRRLRGSETQAVFAARLGVHANTLARYERGDLATPEPVALLAKLLTRERQTQRRS